MRNDQGKLLCAVAENECMSNVIGQCSGLGLRFVRDLEQGKETVRMDKVNQALAMFGMQAIPGKCPKVNDEI